ncbi:MAG: hypothetical protein A2Y38_19505 [Spirochaetes bacterium GWB1_59_5]|nr:MAG: hypothetical protein A2Y38_19505 [Spirochaetes bacterium GWB1_59_5]
MKKLSDLVPDYCTPADELLGTSPLRGTRDEVEVVGTLPGDDPHPLGEEHNPFLYQSPHRLRLMIQSGLLDPEEEQRARKALRLLQVQQSDCTHEGGGFRPPHP